MQKDKRKFNALQEKKDPILLMFLEKYHVLTDLFISSPKSPLSSHPKK